MTARKMTIPPMIGQARLSDRPGGFRQKDFPPPGTVRDLALADPKYGIADDVRMTLSDRGLFYDVGVDCQGNIGMVIGLMKSDGKAIDAEVVGLDATQLVTMISFLADLAAKAELGYGNLPAIVELLARKLADTAAETQMKAKEKTILRTMAKQATRHVMGRLREYHEEVRKAALADVRQQVRMLTKAAMATDERERAERLEECEAFVRETLKADFSKLEAAMNRIEKELKARELGRVG